MWKWIGVAALVLIVLVGTCTWAGYSKLQSMASGDSTSTVVIHAPPDRVFASLATGDSIPGWMVTGAVRPSRAGQLRPGDTLYITERDSARQRMDWVVKEVAPPRVFTLEMTSDTLGLISMTRRFVLEPRGDSTAVLSTIVMAGGDSATKRVAGEGAAGAMLGFASKVVLGAIRMQSQYEVSQLKARLEGQPASAAPTP